ATPRTVAVSTRRVPGSTAPGGAKAARTPTFVLGAPQITENFWEPVETRQRRRRWPWLSPSSRSIASISPTTTPRTSGASGVTAATSIPAFVSRSAASAGDSRRSTNSWSHLYGIFMVTGAAGPAHSVGGLRKARRGSVRPRPVARSARAAGPAHSVGGLRKARRGSVRPRPVARSARAEGPAHSVGGLREARRGAVRPRPVARASECELQREDQGVAEDEPERLEPRREP